jgi:FRG domain
MTHNADYVKHLETLRAVVSGLNAVEILPTISRIAGTSTLTRFMWRGQSRIEWEPIPTLYRRVLQSKLHPSLALIRGLESKMCERAASLSYASHSLSTTLAQLQHYGAATRLLDVTRDPAIAVWFAVSEILDADFDGVVYGFDTSRMEDASLELDDPKRVDPESPAGPRILDCTPSDRQLQQRAAFLVPKVVTGDYRDLLPPTDGFVGTWISHDGTSMSAIPPPAVAVRIPSSEKGQIRETLRTTFGMNSEYLFPDLAGFCGSRATGIGITQEELPLLSTGQTRNTPSPYPCLIIPSPTTSTLTDATYTAHEFEEFSKRAGVPMYAADDSSQPWIALQTTTTGVITRVYSAISPQSTSVQLKEVEPLKAAEVIGLIVDVRPTTNTWLFSGWYPGQCFENLARFARSQAMWR